MWIGSKEFPLRKGEQFVDARQSEPGLRVPDFNLSGHSKPSDPRLGNLAKGLLLILLFFIGLPIIVILLALAAESSGAVAGPVEAAFALIILGLLLYFGVKHLGGGSTYLVTTWRAMVLDRSGKVLQECYLKDVVPISAPYTATHGTSGSHPKGDIDFHSSTSGAFVMRFPDIDYPEELKEKIKIAQTTRLDLCKVCGLPMSGPGVIYCAMCGVKQ